MRDQLPISLTKESTKFSEVISAANRSLQPGVLEIQFGRLRHERWVKADDQLIHLPPTSYYLLSWLATRRINDLPPVDFGLEIDVKEFIKFVEYKFGSVTPHFERMIIAIVQCKGESKDLRKYFQGLLTKYNSSFSSVLGKIPANRYHLEKISHPRGSTYQLKLEKTKIIIHK